MNSFGEEWVEPSPARFKKATSSPKGDNAAAASPAVSYEDANDFSPPASCRWIPVAVGAVATLLALIVIVAQAGGVAAPSNPRVVLFIIEGLKATTFEESVAHGTRGPNMRALLEQGTYASCLGTSDTRCCRAQSGAKLGPYNKWAAAPGIASILTGVDAGKHGVSNQTVAAMSQFATTSAKYPSLAAVAMQGGIKVAAFGGGSLLTTIDDTTGRCTNFGVLDFECGVSMASKCTAQQSCNLHRRFAYPTSNGALNEEDMLDDIQRVIEDDVGLMIVHLNRPNYAATQVPGGDFTSSSYPYTGQIYSTDSVVGRVANMAARTISRRRENWLFVGISDHGGFRSQSGTTPDEDEVVVFFLSTLTISGPTALDYTSTPATQMDVVPTVLSWLGLYDPTSANPTMFFDGRRQGTCTDGKNPRNCTRTAMFA